MKISFILEPQTANTSTLGIAAGEEKITGWAAARTNTEWIQTRVEQLLTSPTCAATKALQQRSVMLIAAPSAARSDGLAHKRLWFSSRWVS